MDPWQPHGLISAGGFWPRRPEVGIPGERTPRTAASATTLALSKARETVLEQVAKQQPARLRCFSRPSSAPDREDLVESPDRAAISAAMVATNVVSPAAGRVAGIVAGAVQAGSAESAFVSAAALRSRARSTGWARIRIRNSPLR